ncbi:hypothetical protein ABZ119_09210 [Streptomyces sp. NPDC006288]|uniref:hypothetical protein n=1 Tax=Streptomyces sp. NPDC006288 TaxID=3156743 RepID=UPI0033B1EAFF
MPRDCRAAAYPADRGQVTDAEPTSHGSGLLDIPADAADAGITTSPSSLSFGLDGTAEES